MRDLFFHRCSFIVPLLLFCWLPAHGLPAHGKGGAKLAHQQTVSGYLIDLTCARERVQEGNELGPKHTRKCLQMPLCDRSGFGILTEGNHLLRFDANGNTKTRKLIEALQKNSEIHARVKGTINEDVISVSSLKLE
jgi:hypothetical protein